MTKKYKWILQMARDLEIRPWRYALEHASYLWRVKEQLRESKRGKGSAEEG